MGDMKHIKLIKDCANPGSSWTTTMACISVVEALGLQGEQAREKKASFVMDCLRHSKGHCTFLTGVIETKESTSKDDRRQNILKHARF